MWSFRIRFNLNEGIRLDIDGSSLIIKDRSHATVKLCTADTSQDFCEARSLILSGDGYSSESAAEAAGIVWKDRLIVILAELQVGADFGDRSLLNGFHFTEAGLEWIAKQFNVSDEIIMQDRYGLMVFESKEKIRFAGSAPVKAVVTRSKSSIENVIDRALESKYPLPEKIRLAYDLYSSSLCQESVDARFVLLMMAVETLIDQQPRSFEVCEIVDRFIRDIRESDLPRGEANSLVGSLRYLRKESINQAGRKLAALLEGEEFNGQDSVSFFKECYNLRSSLVHGDNPSIEKIRAYTPSLQRFVVRVILKCAFREN